jgi:hypothetical protein
MGAEGAPAPPARRKHVGAPPPLSAHFCGARPFPHDAHTRSARTVPSTSQLRRERARTGCVNPPVRAHAAAPRPPAQTRNSALFGKRAALSPSQLQRERARTGCANSLVSAQAGCTRRLPWRRSLCGSSRFPPQLHPRWPPSPSRVSSPTAWSSSATTRTTSAPSSMGARRRARRWWSTALRATGAGFRVIKATRMIAATGL